MLISDCCSSRAQRMQACNIDKNQPLGEILSCHEPSKQIYIECFYLSKLFKELLIIGMVLILDANPLTVMMSEVESGIYGSTRTITLPTFCIHKQWSPRDTFP
jgi:hypothetical protein